MIGFFDTTGCDRTLSILLECFSDLRTKWHGKVH